MASEHVEPEGLPKSLCDTCKCRIDRDRTGIWNCTVRSRSGPVNECADYQRSTALGPFPSVPTSILDLAERAIDDRAAEHGDSHAVHERAAGFWSALLGTQVTAHQVELCMVALKLARAVESPSNRDHYVDACGYLQLAWDEVERG